MDPLSAAGRAAPIVSQHGVVGALVLLIMLMALAIVVLWRALASEQAKVAKVHSLIQQIQTAHYNQVLSYVTHLIEQARRSNEFMQALKEIVVRIEARQNR